MGRNLGPPDGARKLARDQLGGGGGQVQRQSGKGLSTQSLKRGGGFESPRVGGTGRKETPEPGKAGSRDMVELKSGRKQRRVRRHYPTKLQETRGVLGKYW